MNKYIQISKKGIHLNPYIIAVDFDGTLCEDNYPLIGAENYELICWLKMAQRAGCRIILWTCRTKKQLKCAVKWCKDKGLIFDAVNKNVKEASKMYGGDSRKIYADMYIDDKMSNAWSLPFKSKTVEVN